MFIQFIKNFLIILKSCEIFYTISSKFSYIFLISVFFKFLSIFNTKFPQIVYKISLTFLLNFPTIAFKIYFIKIFLKIFLQFFKKFLSKFSSKSSKCLQNFRKFIQILNEIFLSRITFKFI